MLAATREQLIEAGYQATTIAAVARRAGVVTTSIYRRWPNKRALVEDAVFSALDTANYPPVSGDLRADLLAWTRLFLVASAHPAARSAIPGLLSDYHDDQESYRRILERGEQPTQEALRDLLAEAAAHGQADPDCDAGAVFELLRGATLIRALTHGTEDADVFCRQIADALLAVATTAAGSAR
ncbi:TetR/AcrR family transcriptional regulator [Nocardia sp. 2]|uniref:TetR/AcrR family transcriptional regulator n=1 Tax=Nocardia acididurans TaxID=2802282 RepID=A0ABS1LZQ8_9NOCA|nr:TetR/AcrR family transcriptional regulator [Nocardia acididurans]